MENRREQGAHFFFWNLAYFVYLKASIDVKINECNQYQLFLQLQR